MSLPNVQAEIAEALIARDIPTDLVTPESHLDIYRNNMYASLIDTLQSAYPLIQALLGDDFFKMTAREYIRQYPSRSSNLHDYGAYFGDFLAEYPPAHHLIYLAEVAEFEWACHKIYLAADAPQFDVQALQTFTPEQYEQLRFSLHPAACLRKFHFPILQILDLCLTNPDEPVDLQNEGINLLIIRKEFDIALIPLTDEDFVFLESLQNNDTLSDAYHHAQLVNPSYHLEEKLPEFIQNKVLVDCYLSEDERDC